MTRARVWSGGELLPGRQTWHYEVYDSKGNLMLQDNSVDWKMIYETARNAAVHIRHMESAGHNLKTPKWMLK